GVRGNQWTQVLIGNGYKCLFNHGELTVTDDSGALLWVRKIDDDDDLRITPAESLLLVATRGELIAFNSITGEELWRQSHYGDLPVVEGSVAYMWKDGSDGLRI